MNIGFSELSLNWVKPDAIAIRSRRRLLVTKHKQASDDDPVSLLGIAIQKANTVESTPKRQPEIWGELQKCAKALSFQAKSIITSKTLAEAGRIYKASSIVHSIEVYLAWLAWRHPDILLDLYQKYSAAPMLLAPPILPHAPRNPIRTPVGSGNSIGKSENPSKSTISPARRMMDLHIDELLDGVIEHDLEYEILERLSREVGSTIVVSAGPGMGKSSLMARLSVHPRIVAHTIPYFFRASEKKLCEQSRSDFYTYLFREIATRFGWAGSIEDSPNAVRLQCVDALNALSKLGTITSDNPLVIIVDGLDEMGADFDYRDSNPLNLPARLPANVHIIYSVRKGTQETASAWSPPKTHEEIDFSKETKSHSETVKRYIRKICEADKEAKIIREFHQRQPDMTVAQSKEWFVQSLANNSGCNFMIVRGVLHDRTYWDGSGLGVDKVSPKLNTFYQSYMNRMTAHKRYGVASRAVFCFALMGSISKWSLLKLVGGNMNDGQADHARELIDLWRVQGLLAMSDVNGSHWLRPFHRTFTEFLILEFEKYDKYDFLVPLFENYAGEISNAFTITDLGIIDDSALEEEWLTIVLLLSSKVVAVPTLRRLLLMPGFWQLASRSKDGISQALFYLHLTSSNPATLQSMRAVFTETAEIVYRLVLSGQLRDRADQALTVEALLNLIETETHHQAGRPGFVSFALVFQDWAEGLT